MIDLSKIEDPALREQLRAEIKADKEASISKRVKDLKDGETTAAKLARLEELETAEKARVETAKATEAQKTADSFAEKQGLKNLDAFKELKAYDKLVNETDEEKRVQFMNDLKKQKPQLFTESKPEGRNLLGLQGATIEKEEPTTKVY